MTLYDCRLQITTSYQAAEISLRDNFLFSNREERQERQEDQQNGILVVKRLFFGNPEA